LHIIYLSYMSWRSTFWMWPLMKMHGWS